MGYTVGMPSIKLSYIEGKGGKHCGNIAKVLKEALLERLGLDLDINHELTRNNYYEGYKSAADLLSYSEKWIADFNMQVEFYNELIKTKIEDRSDPEPSLEKALEGIITARYVKNHPEILDAQGMDEQQYNELHKTAIKEADALREIGKRAINRIIQTLSQKEDNEPFPKMRKIRHDAVVMCATIIKPPQAFMSNLFAAEKERFLLDSIEKFKEIVGKDNVKSVVIHYDELVPHAHIFWQPVTSDGRLCAKEMHNLKFLGRLNREMPQYLREHGWTEIDDCHAYDAEEEQKIREEMGDEAYREYKEEKRANRGRDSKTFKGDMDKKIEAIEKEIKEQAAAAIVRQRDINQAVQTAEEKLKKVNDEICEKEKIIAKLDSENEERIKTLLSNIPKFIPKPYPPKPQEPPKPTTSFGGYGMTPKQERQQRKQNEINKKKHDEWERTIIPEYERECAVIDAENDRMRSEWERKYLTADNLKKVQQEIARQRSIAEHKQQQANLAWQKVKEQADKNKAYSEFRRERAAKRERHEKIQRYSDFTQQKTLSLAQEDVERNKANDSQNNEIKRDSDKSATSQQRKGIK